MIAFIYVFLVVVVLVATISAADSVSEWGFILSAIVMILGVALLALLIISKMEAAGAMMRLTEEMIREGL